MKSRKHNNQTPRQLNKFSFYHSDRHLNHQSSDKPATQKKHSDRKSSGKRYWLILLVLAVIVAGALIWSSGNNSNEKSPSKPKNPVVATTNKSSGKTAANQPKYSINDPSSIWVVVNKHRPLKPINYAPADLVVPSVPMRLNITYDETHVSAKMAGPLEAMFAAASQAGISLNLQSGYRSYTFQNALYRNYVEQQGQSSADEQSARPGYSEHQTGFAADLGSPNTPNCEVAQCFGSTPAGEWLAANSYKFGFIVRYPKGEQAITGYEYEPWHVRYVGKALALSMHERGIKTLEQYFNLPPAPSYN